MKSPDDTAARLARLRREIVDTFMEGDMKTWATATQEVRAILATPNRRSEATREIQARRKEEREDTNR